MGPGPGSGARLGLRFDGYFDVVTVDSATVGDGVDALCAHCMPPPPPIPLLPPPRMARFRGFHAQCFLHFCEL